MINLRMRRLAGALALFVLSGGMARAEHILLGTVGSGSALNWPIYIALEKGFAKEAGLEIEIVSAPSSAAVQQQIASGSIDIGEGGLVDPIRAIDKGAPATIIRIQGQAAPYALLAKAAIKSYADLKGKTVSLGGIKDITRIYLERMLVPNGVKPGEYDMIFAGATSARFAALEAGSADAAILTAPFNFKAQANGYTLLGQTPDYVKDFPFSGYAANSNWVAQHKEATRRFIEVVSRAIGWFNDESNKAEAVQILVKDAKTQPDDAEKTWTFYRQIKMYDTDGSPARSGLGNLLTVLKGLGDLEGSTDIARFYDASLLAK